MIKSNMGPENNNQKQNLTAWLMSGLFGILSGIFLVFGYQLEKYDNVNFKDAGTYALILCFAVILTIDICYVWRNYDGARQGKKLFGFVSLNGKTEMIEDKNFMFKSWAVMVALNTIVILAEFPGFFVYDAQDELNEVLTRTFSTHHPLLHVLLLGGTIAVFHKLTGSWNGGIFIYTFFQMLVIILILAYVIDYLRKKGIGKRSLIAWTLYYGVFPVIVMYNLCSSKDGLFTAFLLYVTLSLIKLVEDREAFLKSRFSVISFVIAAVLMPLFRHNGFYAYLVFLPFAFIYFRKELTKRLALVLAVPVVAYLVINTALGAVFSSKGTDHQEMLTVPIMQMARVYTYEKDSMSPEDIDTLKAYIPEENLANYTPRVSDLVKFGFNNELYEKNSGDFWKLWAKLGVGHPATYLNSWFLTSYGYWYPPALINVYKGTSVFTFTYTDSSYFGYEVEQPGKRNSYIPAIDKFYRYISIGTFHKDAPVLALLFSPGFCMLIYLFVMLYRLSKGKFGRVLPFLPLILTWMTVLLGPTYLVRYVAILWYALPLLSVPLNDAPQA
ncbi:DUF6020 family protein [Butyrivibrio sp. M55]|uniref:DUF6020 family protein n=1 Tax=Butyrivibrio sp. M55 TaxID=1855323 RepID=UPI0008EEDB1D|nr:DUF6020 family protein [Butyrivibrio sp. M55]SFU67170.1 hypothetical protein SAMN05216540_105228 [Butyrivibrio sp. M55]